MRQVFSNVSSRPEQFFVSKFFDQGYQSYLCPHHIPLVTFCRATEMKRLLENILEVQGGIILAI